MGDAGAIAFRGCGVCSMTFAPGILRGNDLLIYHFEKTRLYGRIAVEEGIGYRVFM